MTAQRLRIGDVAAACGITRDALRYYERQGLLVRPRRTAGGFREYDAATIDRIRFIKQAQAQGLSIKEIRELTSYQEQPGRARCRRVHDLLARKLQELDERRRELDAFAASLRSYKAMCEQTLAGTTDADCPVVDDLVKPRAERRTR
jgi:DNA-binding transcriptional MerR regulator